MKQNPTPALGLAELCSRALDEKKAENIRLLDVGSVSTITDYLVVATATSEPHLRALRIELEKVIDADGTRILGTETALESGWIVVDLFDVMVHLFTRERREFYGLERLWKDAAEVSHSSAAAKKAKPAKKRRAQKTAGARKKAGSGKSAPKGKARSSGKAAGKGKKLKKKG